MSLPFKSKDSNSACATQISLRFPLESKKRNGFPSPSVIAWTFVVKPLLAPPGFLVISPFFSPTGVLANLDRSAAQHQRCFVHQILLNQGCEDIFLYSGFCLGPKPTVYALPWAEPLRQTPPWNSCVQPV